jgi:hypothetical protein
MNEGSRALIGNLGSIHNISSIIIPKVHHAWEMGYQATRTKASRLPQLTATFVHIYVKG